MVLAIEGQLEFVGKTRVVQRQPQIDFGTLDPDLSWWASEDPHEPVRRNNKPNGYAAYQEWVGQARNMRRSSSPLVDSDNWMHA